MEKFQCSGDTKWLKRIQPIPQIYRPNSSNLQVELTVPSSNPLLARYYEGGTHQSENVLGWRPWVQVVWRRDQN